MLCNTTKLCSMSLLQPSDVCMTYSSRNYSAGSCVHSCCVVGSSVLQSLSRPTNDSNRCRIRKTGLALHLLSTCCHRSFVGACWGVLLTGVVTRDVCAGNETVAKPSKPSVPDYLQALGQPQWITCDIRTFDMNVLGKFGVIMADPPWEIHQDLPYGTMADDEMRKMNIKVLQDDGVIFLWVTGAFVCVRACVCVCLSVCLVLKHHHVRPCTHLTCSTIKFAV